MQGEGKVYVEASATGIERLFRLKESAENAVVETRRTVLCDGAMGTMLYGRGIFINRCYDELNLSQPDLVRAVHTEYLQAGATVIETNTFGGNRIRLERHGLEEKVREINAVGEKLARERVRPLC